MSPSRLLLIPALTALMGACAGSRPVPELPVAPQVDLARYAGTWYEIASYPNRFQKGCVATRAEYTLRQDRKVAVRNRCRRGSVNAPWDEARGTAKVADSTTNAKLKVTFFWPFYGDYWILDLDPEYRWVLVGAPSRKYLWVLSRTPTLPDDVYQRIVATAQSLGFDPQRLQRTLQEL